VVSSCEHSNEYLGSIKGGEFLDQLSVPSDSKDGLFFCGVSWFTNLMRNHYDLPNSVV
jgi:hypothetical protein